MGVGVRFPGVMVSVTGVAACDFPRSADGGGDQTMIDAPIEASEDGRVSMLDGPMDTNSEVFCLGTFFRICLDAAPTQPLSIEAQTTIDTTNSPLCSQHVIGGDYCVLAATDIMIDSRLRAPGARPLVLFTSGSITTGAAI